MKRRVWHRIVSIWMVCLVMWCIVCCRVKASETDYVITPIITDEALEGEPYFDLTIEPSRKQVVEIEVSNNTDCAVVVHTRNYTGVENTDENSEALSPDEQAGSAGKRFSELLTGNREITIPAGKTYMCQFTVRMPEEGLGDPMAGALVFLLTPKEQEESTEAAEAEVQQQEGTEFFQLSNAGLSNAKMIREGVENLLQEEAAAETVSAEFSYVIPFMLKTGENSASPALILKDISAADYENAITARIQNKTSVSADQVTIDASVRKKGKKKIFFEVREEKAEIPAHSDYELTVPAKGNPVQAGEYTLRIKLSTATAQWEWEKDFTIEEGKVNAAVQSETDMLKTAAVSVRYYLIIIPVLVLTAAAIILGILLYRKKRKEEEAVIKTIIDIIKNI